MAVAHVVFSLPVAYLHPVGSFWPFFLFAGFVVGTAVGIFLCLQWRIIHLAITRRTRFPVGWLLCQLVGLAFSLSAFLTSARTGESVLDGAVFYLLVFGALLIVTSTFLHTPIEKESNSEQRSDSPCANRDAD